MSGVETMTRVAQVVAPIVVGLLLLGVWYGLVAAGVTPTSVPSPLAVVESLTTNFGIVFEDVQITGGNALIGLIGGSVLAIILAGLAARFAPIDGMSAPVVAVLAVVPIVALAPILNSMYGAGEQTARQVIAGIAAFVPVFVTTLRGLRQTLPVQRDLFRATAATGIQTFLKLTLPHGAAVPAHRAAGRQLARRDLRTRRRVLRRAGQRHRLGDRQLREVGQP